jgi:hypothetical protein
MNIPQISTALQNVLGPQADILARTKGFVRRNQKITGSNFAQTLVFGFLNNPKMSYRQMRLVATFSKLNISSQGLEQRFNKTSAEFMKAVLDQAISQTISSSVGLDLELLNRFSKVYIQDGTVIDLPEACASVWQGLQASGNTGCSSLKLHVSWEYKTGQLSGLALANGREHDQQSPWFSQTREKGDLRIADLGFFDLDQFAQDHQCGAFWVSRYKHGTNLWQNGQLVSLSDILRKKTSQVVDVEVLLGKHHRIPCRLLAFPLDDATTAEQVRKLRENARKRGTELPKERILLAGWAIFVTNAPLDLLSPADVLTLYRLRWQIELLFRLWKSETFLDESTSRNPWRVLTEVYAKLIAVLIQHWFILISAWHIPDISMTLVASVIRQFIVPLHIYFNDYPNLLTTLSLMVNALHDSVPRLLKRKAHPSHFQLLMSSDPLN